ncbi:MAG: hypothetical protein K8S20_13165 [Chloroflexi bacterium]|nr:hypothetical protein [Chloroflexota bacterium]
MIDPVDKSRDGSLSRIFNLFFDYGQEAKFPAASWIFIILVYLAGVLVWGNLFNWLQTPLDFHDWGSINFPRYEVVRNALHDGVLPLHIECEKCLHGVTDRFFVLPDVVTTPQMMVLPWIDIGKFIFLDLLLQYTIATAGLLYIRRKFKLSLVAYLFLFSLFNFNGYIQAHYVIGHITWAGYFLFPWFFILIFHFLDHGASYLWVAGMAFLSLYAILAGSQHHFTWMMLFLAFLALSCWQNKKWILTAILFSGFAGAVRLLPPLLGIGAFTSSLGKFDFRSGYPSLGDFTSALVVLRPVTYVVRITSEKLGYWEFDYFIGIVGACFLLFFGVFFWLRDQWGGQRRFSPLLVPTGLVFLLSIGNLYGYTLYRIPLFASERVSARMVSLPLTLLMIVAAVYFQEFLDIRKDGIFRWLAVFSLIPLLNDLYMHVNFWRVNEINGLLDVEVKSTQAVIANHVDPLYLQVLTVGLALTLITLVLIVVLSVRERWTINRLS